ncbi:MAG: hypothetical protein AB7G28_22080 [Pirellulales bacterium]
MRTSHTSLNWLCRNIEQNLERVDAVLAEILDEPAGSQFTEATEPWIDRLFERRRELQSTLAELERQIERSLA